MRIKLTRKDSEDKEDLYLEEGKHVIGRGGILKCNDKRISRQHGSIEVNSDGSVMLTALHINPCFYYASTNLSSMTVLQQNDNRTLRDGDEIALLPDSYHYRISYFNAESDGATTNLMSVGSESTITDVAVPVSKEDLDVKPSEQSRNSASNSQEDTEQLDEIDYHAKDTNTTEDDDVIAIPVPVVAPIDLSDEVIDFNVEDESSPCQNNLLENPSSPSILGTQQTESTTKRTCDDAEDGSSQQRCDDTSSAHCSKRPRVDSPREEKPNVQDLQNLDMPGNMEAVEASGSVKQEEAEEVSPSNSNSDTVKKEPEEDAPPPRDKCDYGASCYRRNPQHRRDTSHPGDADWDTPVPCPYGADCYRQNVQHRNTYTHPAPPAPRPRQPQPGKKNNAKDSKRKTRKTNTKAKKARRDSWSETDDEYDDEDPWLAADSSDEYEPSGEERDDKEEEYDNYSTDGQSDSDSERPKQKTRGKRTIVKKTTRRRRS